MLRFYFYSGVEYDQNPTFIKAFYQRKGPISLKNRAVGNPTQGNGKGQTGNNPYFAALFSEFYCKIVPYFFQ